MRFFSRVDVRDQIIADQRQQIADLLDRLQELVGSVHMHQVAIHSQNKLDAGPIDRGIAGQSGYMSEDEADLRYQHEAGQIDNDALKEALQQLGFENAEIHFQ